MSFGPGHRRQLVRASDADQPARDPPGACGSDGGLVVSTNAFYRARACILPQVDHAQEADGDLRHRPDRRPCEPPIQPTTTTATDPAVNAMRLIADAQTPMGADLATLHAGGHVHPRLHHSRSVQDRHDRRVRAHPYDSIDTGISFSGADVSVMINEDHPLVMAQSGSRRYVMMHTGQTPGNADYAQLNADQNARMPP